MNIQKLNKKLITNSEKGRLKEVKGLIYDGADVNAKVDNGNTALHVSSEKGHLDVVKFLVEKGANINEKDNYDKTALHFSSKEGHLDIVKFLVEKGANVDAKDKDGKTALMLSSIKGHFNIDKFLVENDADVNATDNGGGTALMWSTAKGHLDIVKFLVENGADVNAKDNGGKTILMWSSIFGKLDVTEFLENIDNVFLQKDINSDCDASRVKENDLTKIAIALNLTGVTKENVCKKIADLFSRKFHSLPPVQTCTNKDTLLGTALKDVHPMFFYTIRENNHLYCGDIREFIKLKDNPWTRTPFTDQELNRMRNEYNILKTLVKNLDDEEEVIQETIEITLRRAMSNVLSELPYTNSVEGYLNANSEKTDLFIKTLRTENILTSRDVDSLNNLTNLPNKKLALVNSLKLKLDNDNTFIISGGNRVSGLRVMLEEIYNRIF